jgi:hypothetical protein
VYSIYSSPPAHHLLIAATRHSSNYQYTSRGLCAPNLFAMPLSSHYDLTTLTTLTTTVSPCDSNIFCLHSMRSPIWAVYHLIYTRSPSDKKKLKFEILHWYFLGDANCLPRGRCEGFGSLPCVVDSQNLWIITGSMKFSFGS